jgi:hypothetical protein
VVPCDLVVNIVIYIFAGIGAWCVVTLVFLAIMTLIVRVLNSE